MGDRDEFDGESDAPVPPYEREWRHPAEVSDAARQRHAAESAPPPIGRRATMLVALVSMAASAALLVVTVPKGVDRMTATADTVAAVTTTTNVVTKGSDVPHVPGLRLSGTYFLLPADAPAGLRTVTVGGAKVDVAAVESFAARGYSIARAAHGVEDQGLGYADLSREELEYLLSSGALHVVDMNGVAHAARWSASMEYVAQSGDTHPIDVDSAFTGPGVLMTSDEQVIGVVERHEHRNVLELLSTVLQRVSANDGG